MANNQTAWRSRAKEYLCRPAYHERRIEDLLEERARVRELARWATGFDTAACGFRGKSGANDRSQVAESVARLDELERALDAEIDRLVDVKREIRAVIDRVPDNRQRDLLTRRYLGGWKWGRIAAELGVKARRTHDLHGEALTAVHKILGLDCTADT